MNVQKKRMFRSAETLAMMIAPCLVAAAQVRPGDGRDPIGDEIPVAGQGAEHHGVVLDGGSVFVDLGTDAPLVLIVEGVVPIDSGPRGVRPPREHKKLRLAGGTPGNAGGILVDLDAPLAGSGGHLSGDAVIAGTFGMDGSIVVELPEIEQEVFVQGFEVTPIGNQLSDIGRLMPGGRLVDADAASWDAQPIADAVRGVTSGAAHGLVSLRFSGAARMAGVQRSIDTTVVLGRDPSREGGFVLELSAALAQRTALVDLADSGGATLRFRAAEGLAGTIETVILLDAFADVADELAAVGGLRAGMGRVIGRCGTPDRSLDDAPGGLDAHDGPLGDAGGATVERPEEGELAVSFDGLGDIAPPRRAGAKQPLPSQRSGAARFDGTLGDAGARDLQP